MHRKQFIGTLGLYIVGALMPLSKFTEFYIEDFVKFKQDSFIVFEDELPDMYSIKK